MQPRPLTRTNRTPSAPYVGADGLTQSARDQFYYSGMDLTLLPPYTDFIVCLVRQARPPRWSRRAHSLSHRVLACSESEHSCRTCGRVPRGSTPGSSGGYYLDTLEASPAWRHPRLNLMPYPRLSVIPSPC